MALADTAELIIALNLRGNAERGIRGVNTALDNLTRNATVRGGLGQISQGIGIGLRNSAILGASGIAILAVQVRAGVESLRELENANVQTTAALESTEGVSGQTVASIRALAEEYETLGGVIDDKVIQAGLNVLLTFRRINERAFEPALEAALNLSTAFDQDLQTSIVQIGKALEDPVAGLTNLRRVGVQFTEDQQDQIKALVESNRLYEAQVLILEELEVQVGGRFAAAGRTNEASVARMGDAWEDLQQTLTRGLLPGIDKVSTRLATIFADPAVIARVEDFGERLAGFLNEENLDRAQNALRDTFGYLAGLPWGAIADGLRVAGAAAEKTIGLFRSLPPGVQNTLITLLAANKLTGGLVATGIGQLLSVGLRELRTITAGHVTVVGGTVTGGVPVAGAPSGGGGFGRLLLGLTGAGVAAALAAEFSDEIEGFGVDLRREIVGDFGGLPSGPSEWDWPFGSRNTPTILPGELFGPNGIFGGTPATGGRAAGGGGGSGSFTGPDRDRFGLAELQAIIARVKASQPDMAMRPLVSALSDLTVAVREEPRGKGPFGPLAPDPDTLFPPTVKLDPSQVTDLREPTRLAAEATRELKAIFPPFLGGFRSDSARDNATLTGLRTDTSIKLANLAAKYDSTNAVLGGVNMRLDSANSKLAAIQAKNFSPTIKVENKMSSTVITNNITQIRALSGQLATPY